MPYASVHELPANIRDALPAHGQSIFLAAFNSAFKQYDGDESRTNATAWTAVKQVYEKNEKEEWVRKAKADNLLSFDNLAEFTGRYDITLQSLDTRHPHPSNEAGLYYGVDNFAGTEPEWEARDLVVFVPPGKKVEHLDHAAFTNDPLREVDRLGYRIAGRLNNTRIVTDQGAPRVTTQVMLDDAEAKRYADKRQLGLSDAFDANISDGKLSGKVKPNHVLLFLKCAGKSDGFCGIPNDKGAQFNNLSKGENTMADDETKGLLQSIRDQLANKENPLKSTVDNLNTEITKRDAQIAALTKENAALKESKTALDNLMAERENSAKEARWQEVMNLHQPGLFHKEKEAVERAAFEKDNAGWLMAHIGNLQTVKPAPAKGAEAVGNLAEDNEKPFDTGAARGKLNVDTGRFE